MPLSKYYGGHGEEVLAEMRKKYGDKAERIFYATANAKGQNPPEKKPKSHYGIRK